MMRKRHSNGGFSLIGLALSMIVLGVILSTLMLLTPNMETVVREKTANILAANRNALIGYVGSFGKVPQYDPAHGGIDYERIIPNLLDGYRNTTGYLYDARLAQADVLCQTTTTSTVVSVAGRGLTTVANVAFVIWSNGDNGVVDGGQSSGPKSVLTPVTIALDDILVWATLDELKSVACQEAL